MLRWLPLRALLRRAVDAIRYCYVVIYMLRAPYYAIYVDDKSRRYAIRYYCHGALMLRRRQRPDTFADSLPSCRRCY